MAQRQQTYMEIIPNGSTDEKRLAMPMARLNRIVMIPHLKSDVNVIHSLCYLSYAIVCNHHCA